MARSTFYHVKTENLPDKYAQTKLQIKAIYQKYKGCYGYRRITAAMRNSGNSPAANVTNEFSFTY